MKLFKNMILAALSLVAAACGGPTTIETPAFTVEKPAGFSLGKNKISIPDFSEAAIMTDIDGGLSIIAFPRGPEKEKFLYAQTYGGANAELHACSFGEITDIEIDSRPTSKVDFDGRISGNNAKGTIYTFNDGNYLFLVIGFGNDSAPENIEHTISTIKAKADKRTEEEIGAARIAAIIEVSNRNLPKQIDEVTAWKNVSVDKNRRCIIMDMEISGGSEDIDINYFQNFLDKNRDETVIPTFRNQRSADYLIDIPARLGYDFEYVYTTKDDRKEIGRMHIDNNLIND